MNLRSVALAAVLVSFTGYTAVIIADHGYSFVQVALLVPWAGQMFVDIVIALALFAIWMVGDAKQRALPAWPYLVLILLTGSIGALAYLLHRELVAGRRTLARPEIRSV